MRREKGVMRVLMNDCSVREKSQFERLAFLLLGQMDGGVIIAGLLPVRD